MRACIGMSPLGHMKPQEAHGPRRLAIAPRALTLLLRRQCSGLVIGHRRWFCSAPPSASHFPSQGCYAAIAVLGPEVGLRPFRRRFVCCGGSQSAAGTSSATQQVDGCSGSRNPSPRAWIMLACGVQSRARPFQVERPAGAAIPRAAGGLWHAAHVPRWASPSWPPSNPGCHPRSPAAAGATHLAAAAGMQLWRQWRAGTRGGGSGWAATQHD